jgi:predicted nucleic acid-binding protein
MRTSPEVGKVAGERDERHLNDLRGLLARALLIPTEPINYEEAATLYRTGRRGGETVRKLIDCLIASVAIQAGTPLLHADRDFEVLGLVILGSRSNDRSSGGAPRPWRRIYRSPAPAP